MADSRKLITSLFVLVLLVCQSGVCMAAVSHADAEPSAGSTEGTHSCHYMKSNPEISDNAQTGFSVEGTMLKGLQCCFTGTINSRDIVSETTQVPVLIKFADHGLDSYVSYHTNSQYQNRGHPPEVSVFIQNSVLII